MVADRYGYVGGRWTKLQRKLKVIGNSWYLIWEDGKRQNLYHLAKSRSRASGWTKAQMEKFVNEQ